MAAFAKTKIFYISIGFWLILGVECDFGWSNYKLTIKTGESVTIPCHYGKNYTQQKKYWYSEIDKKKTYTNTTEENMSVIDHPDQSLFTVTMTNLQNKQNGKYYCFVDTEGKATDIYELHVEVQSVPDVSVVSSVSGKEGGDISVQCLYSPGYKNEVKQWCRYKDRSCYKDKRTNTSQKSSVQISDDGRSSFTVLMTGLRLTDSGWYFCSVGEALNPVHLTVVEAKQDTVKVTNESELHKNTSDVIDKLQKNNELLTVWLPVSAALLLLLILVGVFTWRWRPKQDKPQIRERNGSTNDTIYSKPEDPVIYSIINDEIPNDANKDITTYSTIDHIPGSEAKPPEGGTVYSTVAPH